LLFCFELNQLITNLPAEDKIDTVPGSSGQSEEDAPPFPSNVDDAKLVRKIDMRVMPMLFGIYLVAFLDRYVNWPSC